MARPRDEPMIEARKNRVIVCEDINFYWDEPELIKMAEMWERGTSVKVIAKYFKRKDPDEVLIALIHLAREDKISGRNVGLRGEKE